MPYFLTSQRMIVKAMVPCFSKAACLFPLSQIEPLKVRCPGCAACSNVQWALFVDLKASATSKIDLGSREEGECHT